MTRFTTKTVLLFAATILLLIPFSAQVFGQATLPSAGLQQLAFITVPGWTPANASYDVPSFNRITGVMYLTDRPNFGVTTIDMKTLRFLGTIELPNCRATVAAKGAAACSPSGALVIPDLQKLIVTDRATSIYIYDLRVPAAAPTILTGPPGQDELDYDPVNQRAYIGNTASDFAETVVDVKNNRVLGSIALDNAPEQSRWNPVDGLIYVNVPDSHKLVQIDPQQGAFGAVVNAFPLPTGCANAVDIDPVNDTAFLGCSGGPSVIMDLRSGATVQTFPQSFGVDIAMFNPHNRRFYSGARQNTELSPCTKDTANRWAFVEVFSSSPAQFLGGTCTGLGGRTAGIDTLNNNIFVPVQQFPPDPNSATSGQAGIFVFHDPAADVLGVPAGTVQSWTTATLATTGGSGVTGTVAISLRRRSMFVDAGLNGLPANSTSTFLVITTTAGNETINCGVSGSGQGFCQGDLIGDPLIGGIAVVGSGGNRAASGTLTSVATFPTFIPTD